MTTVDTPAAGTLPVTEVFGPTFQGEGPSAGRLAAFIRLGGCNLTCFGCDTPYTWDASRFNLRDELTPMTVDDILGRLPEPRPPLVVITGGEPLLHQDRPAFRGLVDKLLAAGLDIEVETNGTIKPRLWLSLAGPVRFNVSPKLHGPMSRDSPGKRIVDGALAELAVLARNGKAAFKFVVAIRSDVHDVEALVDQHHIPRRQVWVMPEGVTPATVLDHAHRVADAALKFGFNLTLRQHVLLWPDTPRGR